MKRTSPFSGRPFLWWWSAVALSAGAADSTVPSWLAPAPKLPPPAGQVIHVATSVELLAAVDRLGPGETILLADGNYQLPRVMVLQDKTNVTLRGASADPSKVLLRGQGWDSSSDRDDILHIAHCDGVTVAHLTFTDCRSYGIKVEAEHAPRNVHIYDCRFRDIGVRAIKGSAGQDPDVRARGGSIRHCAFENTRIPPPDWLFGGDYISAIDMMALEDWTISDNVFKNIKGQRGGARAAVFIWVRSRRVVVERNWILNCDRGVAFGNPGQSTAHRPGEHLAYVTGSIIRNNFITGGPDCGIELWHVAGIQVAHNTIWRPAQNWSRGIRIGAGTMDTDIVNNLIHGEILLEGGKAELRGNVTGRLEGWLADPASGSPALTSRAKGAIDQGVPCPDAPTDIRRRPRVGPPDVGAWEATSSF